ncbi:hypothetical protein KSP40_PGU019965 [Platanthera guangdongensis]|uniref:Uncharacterized protein n=1 Tax=Platanthera guangdongensis TaxID=2320717 RepID=A0ABR2LFD4_9ASPA
MASLTPPVVFPSPSLSSGFRFRRSISSRRFLRQHGYGGGARRVTHSVAIRSQTLDLSGSFFEIGDEEGEKEPPSGLTSCDSRAALAEKVQPQCPPGLRQYETMAVLRPDMSENERLTLTQKYEEVSCYWIVECSSSFFHYN